MVYNTGGNISSISSVLVHRDFLSNSGNRRRNSWKMPWIISFRTTLCHRPTPESETWKSFSTRRIVICSMCFPWNETKRLPRRFSKRFAPVDRSIIVRVECFVLVSARNRARKSHLLSSTTDAQNKTWQLEEDTLIDLALKWNYFDGILPILQLRQEEIVKTKKKDSSQDKPAEETEQVR